MLRRRLMHCVGSHDVAAVSVCCFGGTMDILVDNLSHVPDILEMQPAIHEIAAVHAVIEVACSAAIVELDNTLPGRGSDTPQVDYPLLVPAALDSLDGARDLCRLAELALLEHGARAERRHDGPLVLGPVAWASLVLVLREGEVHINHAAVDLLAHHHFTSLLGCPDIELSPS